GPPPALGDGLQIGAGAERASGAGEDRDVRGSIGVERAERIGQRDGGGAVDGVADLRALDGDDRDGVFALDANGAHGDLREGWAASRSSVSNVTSRSDGTTRDAREKSLSRVCAV